MKFLFGFLACIVVLFIVFWFWSTPIINWLFKFILANDPTTGSTDSGGISSESD